ncbi:MAG TPA: hypothetical protein VKR83_12860 [Ktedonobacteraceae bacterium]|nr:hypothetical protein [Ktedonobacteraceae bacterium]
MLHILVANVGSTSLKYKLVSVGAVERAGMGVAKRGKSDCGGRDREAA